MDRFQHPILVRLIAKKENISNQMVHTILERKKEKVLKEMFLTQSLLLTSYH